MAALFLSLSSLLMLLSFPVIVEPAADTSKCPQDLEQLATCLDYVQGKSTHPTKACCTNLESVHENEPVCLCELIEASISGNSQLPPINTTLSLQLGPACDVKTKPSRCPDLLGIPASSPQAKIFETGSTTAPSGAPSTSLNETAGSGSNSTAVNSPNNSPSLAASYIGTLIAIAVLTLAANSF